MTSFKVQFILLEGLCCEKLQEIYLVALYLDIYFWLKKITRIAISKVTFQKSNTHIHVHTQSICI